MAGRKLSLLSPLGVNPGCVPLSTDMRKIKTCFLVIRIPDSAQILREASDAIYLFKSISPSQQTLIAYVKFN